MNYLKFKESIDTLVTSAPTHDLIDAFIEAIYEETTILMRPRLTYNNVHSKYTLTGPRDGHTVKIHGWFNCYYAPNNGDVQNIYRLTGLSQSMIDSTMASGIPSDGVKLTYHPSTDTDDVYVFILDGWVIVPIEQIDGKYTTHATFTDSHTIQVSMMEGSEHWARAVNSIAMAYITNRNNYLSMLAASKRS